MSGFAFEAARRLGISLRSYAVGSDHYTTCPRCSAGRKPENRKAACLHVKVEADALAFYCNNCRTNGREWYDQRRAGAVDPRRPARDPSAAERERRHREKRQADADAVWRASSTVVAPELGLYLAGRGVELPPRSEAIRWHANCPFEKKRSGAMVARVSDILTNIPLGVHRTAIDPSGAKRSDFGSGGRLSFGLITGGAVKLCPDEDVTTVLGIGEGIESTLSLRNLPDCIDLPVWSVLSATGLQNFPVLAGIECLWIAVDNDDKGTGQNAARACAARWREAGREVLPIIAKRAGADLNDLSKLVAA